MKKKILALILLVSLSLTILAACSKKGGESPADSSSEPIVPIGVNCNVTKLDNAEEWVVTSDEFDDDYKVPQFNIDCDSTKQLNKKIVSEFKELSKNKTAHPIVSYEFRQNKSLLSVLVTVYGRFSEKKYNVYNISLSDGSEASPEAVARYMGFSRTQFRNLCVEALKDDYKMRYYSFPDYNSESAKKEREKISSTENIDRCIPYLKTEDKLNVIGYIYTLSNEEMVVDVPLQREY